MLRESTPEDLIASWTLVEDDWRLVSNKTGATRLGFAALLKFCQPWGLGAPLAPAAAATFAAGDAILSSGPK